ncbi:MAG: endonuclease/exonuclease/phosphatase family protein [Bradymonadaceae bacterium]
MPIITTFNTGLFRGLIDEVDRRRDKLIDELIDLEADVVCLQEVWLSQEDDGTWSADDLQRIVTGVEEAYPYHWSGRGEGIEEGFVGGGHHGLLILSRHPFLARGVRSLPSVLIQRAVLHARIDVADYGVVDVFNTHVAADLSHLFAHPGGRFSSFVEEQGAQLDMTLSWIEEISGSNGVILAGDLNTGPEGEAMVAELPENFAKFRATGFFNANIDGHPHSFPTYCAENSLTTTDVDRAIDHILLDLGGGPPVLDEVRRLWDKPLIETSEGRLLHLSDHYGLLVSFH